MSSFSISNRLKPQTPRRGADTQWNRKPVWDATENTPMVGAIAFLCHALYRDFSKARRCGKDMGNQGCTRDWWCFFLGIRATHLRKQQFLQGKGQEDEIIGLLYLLRVVGCVGQHGGHMKHNLIVLVARIEGVCSRGVGCTHTHIDTKRFSNQTTSLTKERHMQGEIWPICCSLRLTEGKSTALW